MQDHDSATTPTRSRKKETPLPLPAPFDERHYSVKEVGRFLQLSNNVVQKMFRDEPGVFDLSRYPSGLKKLTRKRKRTVLRIPHSVLVRVVERCEIRKVS